MQIQIRASLCDLRKNRGWSRRHLADVAEVSEKTIERIETGKSIGYETAMKIADALETSVEALRRPPGDATNSNSSVRESPQEVMALGLLETPRDLAAHLDALAIHEVRKLAERLENPRTGRRTTRAGVFRLMRYADSWGQYSSYVRAAVIEAISGLISRTRRGMNEELADACSSVIRAAVPISFCPPPKGKAPLEEYLRDPLAPAFLRRAAELGHDLAYDGGKSLQNLRVVEAGGDLLHAVMRHARIQDDVPLREFVHEQFERAIEAARRAEFTDAVRWLEFEEADAIAVEDDPLPDLPEDLMGKLHPTPPRLRRVIGKIRSSNNKARKADARESD